MKIVDVGVGGQAREEGPAETEQPSKGDHNRGAAPSDFHVSLFKGSSDNAECLESGGKIFIIMWSLASNQLQLCASLPSGEL